MRLPIYNVHVRTFVLLVSRREKSLFFSDNRYKWRKRVEMLPQTTSSTTPVSLYPVVYCSHDLQRDRFI